MSRLMRLVIRPARPALAEVPLADVSFCASGAPFCGFGIPAGLPPLDNDPDGSLFCDGDGLKPSPNGCMAE